MKNWLDILFDSMEIAIWPKIHFTKVHIMLGTVLNTKAIIWKLQFGQNTLHKGPYHARDSFKYKGNNMEIAFGPQYTSQRSMSC